MAQQIYELIKIFANCRRKSLKEIGREAGIGENTIYRWRKDLPALSTLVKVAKVWNVNYKELLP